MLTLRQARRCLGLGDIRTSGIVMLMLSVGTAVVSSSTGCRENGINASLANTHDKQEQQQQQHSDGNNDTRVKLHQERYSI